MHPYKISDEEIRQMQLEDAMEISPESDDATKPKKKHDIKWALKKAGKTAKQARKIVPKKIRKNLKKK